VVSAVAYAALVPLVVAVAYATYRVAERPFFSAFARAAIDAHRTAPAPALTPARAPSR
jgi:hypothetical protein